MPCARRIEAGGERRPRHGTLRRHRRAERRKAAHLRQPREIRQAARLHQRARELIVEPIESKHDHYARPSPRSAPRQRRRRPATARTRRTTRRDRRCASFRLPGLPGVSRTATCLRCDCGIVHAEQMQRRRRDIDQRRIGRVDRTRAEEHAGHEPRIDAVIAAPRPSCCPRRPAPRRHPTRNPTTHDSRCCSPRADPARCPRKARRRWTDVSNISRIAIGFGSPARIDRPLNFAISSAFNAAASRSGRDDALAFAAFAGSGRVPSARARRRACATSRRPAAIPARPSAPGFNAR